jgi:hypothetical protein
VSMSSWRGTVISTGTNLPLSLTMEYFKRTDALFPQCVHSFSSCKGHTKTWLSWRWHWQLTHVQFSNSTITKISTWTM